ncbi:MAG: class I SAM-dependent methyltransferase, partial [Deltaproteobacteria bacterium]
MRDFEHGLAVLADFDACPSCGLIAQVPPPDAAALATYYPSDYRPHAAAVSANGVSLMTRLKDIQASMQIRRLAKFLPPREHPILELGCGGGHFLRALEREGYTDLTGIDRTPELGRAFKGTRIRYRAIDLDRTLDLGGPYQAIVMNYVIEH